MSLNLINFFDWFKSNLFYKPWLVVGKGPSFDMVADIDLNDYHVVGLNHVMFKIPCLLGHATDFDVIKTPVSDNLCLHIVTPWEPHINFKPCGTTALNLFSDKSLGIKVPVLWYNSSRSKALMIQSGPVVRVKLFSAVAVINLLASAGVKEVLTLGVDEGTEYSKAFSDDTKLANGRTSFKGQYKEFKMASKTFGVSVKPLFKVP